MARIRVDDHMSAYPFWLVDIKPNLNPPFFALNPLAGFKSCSSVEITLNHTEYRPLDRMHPVHMIDSADIAPITLSRGALLGESDFYRWVQRHENGTDRSRRNLLLVHFLTKGKDANIEASLGPIDISGPFSGSIKVPGRAWILWDCVPSRYSYGEFDATSSDIVVSEIEVKIGSVTQVDLGLV